MTDVTRALEQIEAAAKDRGLPALARDSGVPYTTLVDWQKANWRPKAIQTLEKLALAASARRAANDDDGLKANAA